MRRLNRGLETRIGRVVLRRLLKTRVDRGWDSLPAAPVEVAGGTGEAVGFADLDAAALRIARLLHDRGLRPGDRIAVLMENGPAWFRVC